MARPDPGRTDSLAHARLQAVVRLLPAIQLFSVLDAVLLSWYFWTDTAPGFLIAWTAAVAMHGAFWWWFSKRGRTGPWLVANSVGEAILFSVFIVVLFPTVPADKAVVLAAFVTGLLAAGALSKMSWPAAAHLFILCLTLGAAIGFALSTIPSPWIPELMLLGFAAALTVLVTEMSKVFDARVEAEQDLARQKALVSDLLDDFGSAASEGLWEVDRNGRLTYVSPRLAVLFGRPVDDLLGQALAPNSEWALTWDRTTAFRNLEIPIDSNSGRRWWSLTGKPVREEGRILGWRGVASDVTDQRQRELEVLRMSNHDRLTGLLNRAAFRTLIDELLTMRLVPAVRALALIDIVDFKEVNETRGHAFGDALLAAVAERLRSVVPERLVLARLDGDEFALQGEVPVSIDETLKNLSLLMNRLSAPYVLMGDRFEAGFRLGVSFTPTDAETPDQWLRCSDLALRSAKTHSAGRIQRYEPSMMDSFSERSALKEALRGAQGRGEVRLEYQPIVNLATRQITGFEALARWTHPTRGNVSPAVFIPLAEETEVILDLGLWILEEACRTAASWPEDVTISVNVSGVQLRSTALADQVLEILKRVGLSPTRLVLEVTESALVRNDTVLAGHFSALKDHGIRWALDDFGTGYSSLSYLQDFPFDKLKIDQSFVRPTAARPPSPALLGAIVSLARSLGLTTTAEGIEDEGHFELLRSLGCDKGQGYLFSRPVTGPKATELLGQRKAVSSIPVDRP